MNRYNQRTAVGQLFARVSKRAAQAIGLSLLLLAHPAAQVGTVMPSPVFTAFDSNGNPISSGKLCVYTAGTATFANTYTDSTLAVANLNPVVMSSAGRATVFLVPGASYKFVLRAAGSSSTECTTGAIQWTVDRVGAVPTSSNNLDVLGTAGEAITAGQAVYLSDGSGSKTAGQWYRADATTPYSSTTGIVGLAPSAISSVTAGTIRLNGIVTGLSALTVGTTYYLSATPGTLTATAPTNNRRPVGVADTTSSVVLTVNPNVPAVDLHTCNGRLTLESNVPVSVVDQTAKTTLYWSPIDGNRCALYDGTWWTTRTFVQLSIVIPSSTSQLYDVYLYDNAGTLALELNAWTNDTTPATLHSGSTFYQDGVAIKAGTATRRFLGVMRTTTVSGQSEDSLAKRLVWNYYNRVTRPLRVLEATDTWTYETAAWHQANASTANQLAIIVGVPEVPIHVDVRAHVANASGSAKVVYGGIGEDVTNAIAVGSLATRFDLLNGSSGDLAPSLVKYPAVGYHFYSWLEYGIAGLGAGTWVGDGGQPTVEQSGILGWIEG